MAEAKAKARVTETKACTRCKQVKPLDRFYRRNDRPCGYHAYCKACDEERRVEIKRAHPEWQWHADIRRHFNLSPDQWNELLASQYGGCAICGATEAGGIGRFHVDHDHKCCPGKRSCGKCVRGLLCNRCNTGIGQFKDDPSRLDSAARYLRRHNAEGVMP